jgi:Ser/Thr protein kinase RdoA (MazF antagonist)
LFIEKAASYFSSKGFPIPKILARGTILNQTAVISEELIGKVNPEFNEFDYHKIGFFLANLHKASEEFSSISPTLPFIWNLSSLFLALKDSIPKEFFHLEKEIYLIEETWPKNIPKGFIHGDLWHKNILYSDNEITGVLEFNPSYEPYILDIANLSKGIFHEKPLFMKALLEGYEIVRPLSIDETTYLPLMVYAKTIKTILVLLEKSLVSVKRKDEFQTYAYLGLLKLESLYESVATQVYKESDTINALLERPSFDIQKPSFNFNKFKFV